MSKMNLLVDLKGYDGTNANTCQANFKRNSQYVGIDLNNETIQEVTVPASGSKTLFDDTEASKFIYIEASAECTIQINDLDEVNLKPIIVGDSTRNGMYLKTADINKVVIGNSGTADIKIYYITSK
jgi:hypothetical protein